MSKEYPLFDGTQLCAQTDPDLWFPTALHQTGRLAKSLCQKCPWIEECLEFALHHDVVGIWGGTTEKERAKLRRERKIEAEPLYSESLFSPSLRGKVPTGRYNEQISEVFDV